MCFCCSSTRHVVKDCPKGRNRVRTCDPVNAWRRGEAVTPIILPAPTPGSGDEPSVMDTTPSEPSSNSQNSTSTADDPVATQSTLASPSLTYAEAAQSSQELFSPSSEASEGVGPSKRKAPPPSPRRSQRTRARRKNRLTIRAQFSRIS